MMTRTVTVDRRRLEKLLSDRVSSPEKLAADSGCHIKTVERAMKGKPLLRSTVRDLAAALNVEPQMLLAWEDPVDDEPSQVIEFVIRGHRPALEQSSVLLEFISLLSKLLGQPSEVKFRTYESGHARFNVTAGAAATLVARFDEFEEQAFELIRHSEFGQSYFRGESIDPDQAERLRGLVELVESVAELRLPGPWVLDAPPLVESSEVTVPTPSLAPEPNTAPKPPPMPTSNPYLQWDLVDLERFYVEAESETPGPDRDLKIRQIAEAIDFTRAIERFQAENPDL